MNITDLIAAEHGLLRFQFDYIRGIATANPAGPRVVGAGEMMAKLLMSHARLEEDLLFAALEPRLGSVGRPATVVHRDEHRKIEKLFEDALRHGSVLDGLMEAIDFALYHFRQEEEILLPLSARFLSASHLERLGQVWAESRGVTGR